MMIKNIISNIIYKLRGNISTDKLVELGLKIGKNFRRNEDCIIDRSHCWLISIGDNVTLAPRVHILAHDASMWKELGYAKIGYVEIGDNVFIGAGTIVLPGVKIGNDVVIGAGSVVVHDVQNNSVVAGNPAKLIMRYDEFIEKHRKCMMKSKCYDASFTLRNSHITNQQKMEMLSELKKNKIAYVE